MTKKANFLMVKVGNRGNTDALRPTIGLMMRPSDKKEPWWPGFFTDYQARGVDFKEISVKTDREFESVSEPQLAYALVTNGLERADTLMKKTASAFVIAFAFEGSESFYFADDKIAPIRADAIEKVTLSGRATQMPAIPLSLNYNFIFAIESWDKMKLTTTEEAF